jgi:hypothetical protein
MKALIYRIKIPLLFLVVFLLLPAGNPAWAAADSPPVLPASFWGAVTVEGSYVDAGTIITAKLEDTVVGSTTVESYQDQSVYAMIIPGDASMENLPVDFYIGDQQADQSYIWNSGSSTHLNLTIMGDVQYQVFIPLIVH